MTDDLRIHADNEPGPRAGGELVLYWMQTTHRAHDNHALEFAIEQANALGLPVVVYHGLRPDYPWASDRLHTYVLEAVIDLYDDFAARGIQYGFYLDPGHGHRPARSPLVELAERAALVVTDYFPTFIVPRQIRSLRRKIETPVVAVDSCTIVPMRHLGREHSTARSIRPVLLSALPRFLHRLQDTEPRIRRPVDLPFDPVVPTAATIPSIVAGLPIDHGVTPARQIRGGTRAGRARLAEFLERGLPFYAESRGDPNAEHATSRLSPYLHFGNLSPHEVVIAARDAGPSAEFEKYQDEAVVWRELAYNFVHYNPKHRTVEAIPAWARDELRAAEADPRPVLYTDDELEYARTGDELWNAAQRAYLVDGWMHNTMRLLWGKAAVMWTPNAAECLRVLEYLNNKYSLDGRDPASYGGIHWIFGKFDRPFYRRPVYGTVRYQSLKAAAGKFDTGAYISRHAQATLGVI
ncbi:MAG TPA: deoxyribodipyrimidine photo-lyase [Gemmatimonadales bacterium]|nr:deoxyribodipyrimidine photo-lyase [Gemmatimonadales bacterium]